ncbi:MAG TPA: ergothioneine biosynthesis protein EgtB [Rhodocyclaceae bacterium]|nr:ergothioneine biosynthesis protein EgtB [Rhodocyclaceae bacterium]
MASSNTRQLLITRYDATRALSKTLAQPLSAEDQCVQSMPDASPTKWHLAHTSWFFETVVLTTHNVIAYRPFDERFAFLFNSYYESLGPRHPRSERGLLTRPTSATVLEYRAHVDTAMRRLIEEANEDTWAAVAPLIVLGLNHEQQHQELLLTDIKHLLSRNPLQPAYAGGITSHRSSMRQDTPPATQWIDCAGGRVDVGHDQRGFAFDNETPRHAVLLQPHQLANRLVTCGEYLEFIADGGYKRPEFWLSDGWAMSNAQQWQAPLYWQSENGKDWRVFTLNGVKTIDASEPVCHISFYEAAAYAAWARARLPTEFEWEAAAANVSGAERAFDTRSPHPRSTGIEKNANFGFAQLYGETWQWTRSSYDPYPGFKPHTGAIAEYNGKFMVGQIVLRGGSCATPDGHARSTYRNFFPPSARWQFSGIRLARDL